MSGYQQLLKWMGDLGEIHNGPYGNERSIRDKHTDMHNSHCLLCKQIDPFDMFYHNNICACLQGYTEPTLQSIYGNTHLDKINSKQVKLCNSIASFACHMLSIGTIQCIIYMGKFNVWPPQHMQDEVKLSVIQCMFRVFRGAA